MMTYITINIFLNIDAQVFCVLIVFKCPKTFQTIMCRIFYTKLLILVNIISKFCNFIKKNNINLKLV